MGEPLISVLCTMTLKGNAISIPICPPTILRVSQLPEQETRMQQPRDPCSIGS